MNNNKIVVWGIDGHNTLGLLRQLGDCGQEIVFLLLGKVQNCATKSKYCRGYIQTETIQEGYDYLMNHYVHEPDKPVIITPSDEIIEFIDQHRQELLPHFLIPGTSQSGLLTKLDSKIEMAQYAEKVGIDVPQSLTVNKGSMLDGIKYPCFLKPSRLKTGHKNEFKFRICANEKELVNTLKYVRPDSEFLLQQYIPTEEEYVVYGCRMMDNQTVIAGTFIRQRFCDNGDSSYGLITSKIPPTVSVEKIYKYLEDIDYHGLFSFEYGLFQNKAYFFEVNFRNDGTSQSFFKAGANLPLAWVYSVTGHNYNSIGTKVIKDQFFIDEICDYACVIHKKVSKKQWIKERDGASIYKYYDENDMAPYNAMKKQRLKKLYLDAFIKKYRLYVVYLMDKLKH